MIFVLTCNQELSEEHKHKMIEEHHGLLHESGGALLRLGNKIEDLQITFRLCIKSSDGYYHQSKSNSSN